MSLHYHIKVGSPVLYLQYGWISWTPVHGQCSTGCRRISQESAEGARPLEPELLADVQPQAWRTEKDQEGETGAKSGCSALNAATLEISSAAERWWWRRRWGSGRSLTRLGALAGAKHGKPRSSLQQPNPASCCLTSLGEKLWPTFLLPFFSYFSFFLMPFHVIDFISTLLSFRCTCIWMKSLLWHCSKWCGFGDFRKICDASLFLKKKKNQAGFTNKLPWLVKVCLGHLLLGDL